MEEREELDTLPAPLYGTWGPVEFRDPCLRYEISESDAAEGYDHLRLDDPELFFEPGRVRPDLPDPGITVSGWPARDDIGDEYLIAPDPDALEELIEYLPSPPDERPPLSVLHRTRCLTDEDDASISWSCARHYLGPTFREFAASAALHYGEEFGQGCDSWHLFRITWRIGSGIISPAPAVLSHHLRS